jgi:hypothetical protein
MKNCVKTDPKAIALAVTADGSSRLDDFALCARIRISR